MPNIKSAAKRIRQSEKRNARNKSVKSGIHTQKVKFLDAIAAGDKTLSEEMFKKLCSAMDKGVKHGIIKANTASRNKSRASKKLAALK